MAETTDVRLEPIDTSLAELSFAEASAAALEQWAANLPLVNISETANQLNLATAELALLDAEPEQKLACLEAVRPLIHYICARLDRATFKNKKQHQESLAQHLLLNLCTGYKGVILEAIAQVQTDKAKSGDVLPKAIHRLIADLSRSLLRALQLYAKPPTNFWWELNELYRLSEVFAIDGFSLADEENHSSIEQSIADTYKRALLLDSCKHNQLQHAELTSIFNALEYWTAHVAISTDTQGALLIVDLCADHGPTYSSFAAQADLPRGMNVSVVAFEIEAFLNDVHGHIYIPTVLSKKLLRHLADAWSVVHDRKFGRFATNSPVRVAIGLRATHYFLSGGCDFSDQISSAAQKLRREINPFLEVDYEPKAAEDADPWSQAHDLKIRIPINPNIEAPESLLLANNHHAVRAYEHIEMRALDSSPGGYRLEFVDAIPNNANVGELIALREEKAPRWCVAAIRWISQEDQRAFMGVELLSPRAIPVAIRAIQKRGGPTDYARALILPEIEAIGQSATLITPTVPFISRQKVNLQRQGIQNTAQLLESQRKTQSFNQFTFRMLDGYLENPRSDSIIDSLSAMTREDTSQGS